jgi:hypothetical protein
MKGQWVPIEAYARVNGLPMEAVEEMIGDSRMDFRVDTSGRTLVREQLVPGPIIHGNDAQAIPGRFAERALNSLMNLHNELMAEKESRLDLYRKLMEREQAVAELKSLVRLLEGELATATRALPAPVPQPPAAPVAAPPPVERVAAAPPAPPAPAVPKLPRAPRPMMAPRVPPPPRSLGRLVVPRNLKTRKAVAPGEPQADGREAPAAESKPAPRQGSPRRGRTRNDGWRVW